jgi:H+/Cl- antiporter ClcA
VGALLLLLVCKGVAYSTSMSGFRGGPVFPAMFIGAAGGIVMSHLPGLPLVSGVAMGIGAMSAVMLRLPLTSVLLATVLLSSDALAVTPVAIVAVVVAYVTSARLAPAPAAAGEAPSAAPAPTGEHGPDEPQDREDEADQAQHPVTLAERHDGQGEQQDQVHDAQPDRKEPI